MSNNNPSQNLPPGGGSPGNAAATWGPKDTARLLVAGFLGGLMTPMIQPIQELLKSHHYPADFGAGYWLIGAALGVLGVVMVWLLKETDVKKALILGLSLPAFFTSLGGALQNSGGYKVSTTTPTVINASIAERGAAGILSFFATSAYAQPVPTPISAASARSLKVTREGEFAYRLELLDDKGNVTSTPLDVKASESLPVTLALPDNAVGLRFTAGAAVASQAFNAKSGQTVDVTLKGEGLRRQFDIAQVLGKTPDLVPDKLSAEVNVRP
jgi:hypothetical protein